MFLASSSGVSLKIFSPSDRRLKQLFSPSRTLHHDTSPFSVFPEQIAAARPAQPFYSWVHKHSPAIQPLQNISPPSRSPAPHFHSSSAPQRVYGNSPNASPCCDEKYPFPATTTHYFGQLCSSLSFGVFTLEVATYSPLR